MSDAPYRSTPVETSNMPAGIPYIIGNEVAERFSFYGMKAILVVFMTKYLMAAGSDQKAVMDDEEAKTYYHLFVASAYFFPLIGAMISDALWGKYRTIMVLSIVYCLGHLALALDESRIGLFVGLILIAIGSGGIKPCVSAHVGDQFGRKNSHMMSKVYGWFYCAVNVGAAISSLLTPVLLNLYGPKVAFGVPGALMAIATVLFWAGRNRFIHVPPSGKESVRQAFSGEGVKVLANLALIYVFVAVFWSLFDQTGSAWVQQARRMDLSLSAVGLDVELLPSQIQAANPIFILILVPIFSYFLYPAINRVFRLTPLRKIGMGLMLTVPAFALPAWVESTINGGQVVSSTSEGDSNLHPAERLIDGDPTNAGWVSGKIEQDKFKNQDIVIRLRERREWKLDSITIHANGNLLDFIKEQQKKVKTAHTKSAHDPDSERVTPVELAESFLRDEFDLTELHVGHEANDLARVQVPVKEIGRLVEPANRQKISDRLRGLGFRHVTIDLDGMHFTPEYAAARCQAKEIKIFSGKTRLGDPLVESTVDEKKWEWQKELASIEIEANRTEPVTIELDDPEVEYLLVRVTSNHGGDYVGLGEITVNTTEQVEGGSSDSSVGSNVAAIGKQPSIMWQIIAYVLMTAAEVMVSITCLEFSYTQSPKAMKSFVMAVYLLSVSGGNAFTALVNWLIQNEDASTKLEGASYYWFFTVVMLATAVLFIFASQLYRGRSYIQGEETSDAK